VLPLFVKTATGKLRTVTSRAAPEVVAGDTLLALVGPVEG
jgi:hypothetical protein